MDTLKERLYEAIDVAFEGEALPEGICSLDQLRLGRASDGTIRLYFDDCLGLGRIALTAENARTLLDQLREALKEEKPAGQKWVPAPYPYGPVWVTSYTKWCEVCRQWVSGPHTHDGRRVVICASASDTKVSTSS